MNGEDSERPVASEDREHLVFQGPRGPQGNQGNQGNMGNQGNPGGRGVQGSQGGQGERGERGERGAPGLSVAVRRALVFLFVLAMVFGMFNLLWDARQQAAFQSSQQREQAVQHQAGLALGEKLCVTFGRLAALKPPAGNPAKNPSRAYDQELHATLDQLGTDLGCR